MQKEAEASLQVPSALNVEFEAVSIRA